MYYENPFEDPEYFTRFEDPQYHVPFRHESGQYLVHKCTEGERRILRKEGDEFRKKMHELGLRKCEGGPWLTEGAWNEHYAPLRRTLKSVGDDAVATIEESSEDTSSYISVHINEQQTLSGGTSVATSSTEEYAQQQ